MLVLLVNGMVAGQSSLEFCDPFCQSHLMAGFIDTCSTSPGQSSCRAFLAAVQTALEERIAQFAAQGTLTLAQQRRLQGKVDGSATSTLWSQAGSVEAKSHIDDTFNNFLTATSSVTGAWINEFHYDNSGSDVGEFVEVMLPLSADPASYSLEFYNGANDQLYNTIPLSGGVATNLADNAGKLVVVDATGVQNGPDAIALVDTSGDSVVECLAYEGSMSVTRAGATSPTECHDIGVLESSSTAAGQSLQRIDAGAGSSAAPGSWVLASETPGQLNTGQDLSGTTSNAATTTATAAVSLCDDGSFMHIGTVQGAGSASPFVGQEVAVRGVVLGVVPEMNGFFMQSPDNNTDGDNATSDGIFVYGDTNAVTDGDDVVVVGQVSEYYENTQVSMSSVVRCAEQLPPPSPYLLTQGTSSLEPAEGMSVRLDGSEFVIVDVYNLARYNQFTVLRRPERFTNPTQVIEPGPAAVAQDAEYETLQVVVGDASNAQNLETVIFPWPALAANNTLRSGDVVTFMEGGLMYIYGAYHIIMGSGADAQISPRNPRASMPADVHGTLKVAMYNVLNYFTTTFGSRGADSAEELARQSPKTVSAIVALGADVMGLVEVQNDGFGNGSSIEYLVEAINEATSPGNYETVVFTPALVGTDQITNKIIYRPSVVAQVGVAAILNSSVDSDFIDTKSRPAIAATFQELATQELFTVVVLHLRSRAPDCDEFNDPNLDDGAGECNFLRTWATRAVGRWLATQPTGVDVDKVIITGDLNAHAMELPVQALVTEFDYTDLIKQHIGDEAYSYVYRGRSAYIDHMLGSPTLKDCVTGVDIWHINSDEPPVLDYNIDIWGAGIDKTASQLSSWYSPGPFRSSDHDPVLIGLNFSQCMGTGDTTNTIPALVALLSASNTSTTTSEQIGLNATEDQTTTTTTTTATSLTSSTGTATTATTTTTASTTTTSSSSTAATISTTTNITTTTTTTTSADTDTNTNATGTSEVQSTSSPTSLTSSTSSSTSSSATTTTTTDTTNTAHTVNDTAENQSQTMTTTISITTGQNITMTTTTTSTTAALTALDPSTTSGQIVTTMTTTTEASTALNLSSTSGLESNLSLDGTTTAPQAVAATTLADSTTTIADTSTITQTTSTFTAGTTTSTLPATTQSTPPSTSTTIVTPAATTTSVPTTTTTTAAQGAISTTTTPASAMRLKGDVQFNSADDFHNPSIATPAATAFSKALAWASGVEDSNISVSFSMSPTQPARRLQAARLKWTAGYSIFCSSYGTAQEAAGRLQTVTVGRLQTAVSRELFKVLRSTVNATIENISLGTLEQVLPGCPQQSLDERLSTLQGGSCVRQDGQSVMAGFIEAGGGCCIVCADWDAYADGDTGKCRRCPSGQEVNADGSGCTEEGVSVGSIVGIIVGTLVGVALFCGCWPLLPPVWLWVLDMWVNRKAGAKDQQWKQRLRPFYKFCNGGSAYPSGHWVLQRPCVRVSDGLCTKCNRSSGRENNNKAKQTPEESLEVQAQMSKAAEDAFGLWESFTNVGADFEAGFEREDNLPPTTEGLKVWGQQGRL